MQRHVIIRETVQTDLSFLKEMLFEAFFWDPAVPRPLFAAFSADTEFRKLLNEWGRRLGDKGVIAEQEAEAVGADWFRLWTVEEHSYGFVSSKVPEVSIAVRQGCRSMGAGRALLVSLVEVARASGYAALSLSGSPKNYALKLYTSMGFRRVAESEISSTLLLSLP